MTATVTKTQSAQPAGQYQPTAVDEAKAKADILILQVGPVVVDSKKSLAGRGITATDTPGRYRVTDSALATLRKQFSVMSDF